MKRNITDRKITREQLRTWYDGYHTKGGERVYNPRSVVLALENNNLGNYWTSSGPYDELFYYIGANVDSVKDDVGLLLSNRRAGQSSGVCRYIHGAKDKG